LRELGRQSLSGRFSLLQLSGVHFRHSRILMWARLKRKACVYEGTHGGASRRKACLGSVTVNPIDQGSGKPDGNTGDG
jgi:hypothetical protein